MTAPTDIDEAIDLAAVEPEEIVDDQGRKIRNRSPEDLQKLREMQSTAKGKPHFGMRFTKLVPPGAG